MAMRFPKHKEETKLIQLIFNSISSAVYTTSVLVAAAGRLACPTIRRSGSTAYGMG